MIIIPSTGTQAAQRLVWVAAGVIGLALLWANAADIEQTVRAQGQVIASARTQVVQATNDGVVRDLPIVEGQRVRKGELLMLLERGQAEAAYGDSTAKVAALKANLIRLRAEVFQRPLAFPADVRAHPGFVENQTQLFTRRQQALHAEIGALNDSLVLVKKELDMSLPLLETGDIGKTEILRLQRQAAEITGAMTNRRNKYFQDAQAEMTKAEEDLATQEQMLAERSTTLERTEIRAPADGLVRRLPVTTPGARVRAGDTVAELLPTGGSLVVEARLKPADRGFVHEGLPASIKLDAYDSAIYGALRGHVRYISPDALTEQTRAGDNVYYLVQITLEAPDTSAASRELKPVQAGGFPAALLPGKAERRLEIQPGMTTTVEIKTGERSVLKYLTKPITKTLGESLSER